MILKLSSRPADRACTHRTQHDRHPVVRKPEVQQITITAPARKSPLHPRAAAATVADIMRPPLTTAGPYDHVAAAAYLMKHAGTAALLVMDAHTGQPTGIITQADIARAIANGKDLNDARVHAVTITRPAVVAVSPYPTLFRSTPPPK